MDRIVLHMGFINTPYTKEAKARPATAAKMEGRRARKRGFSKTMTAEKVANILEAKYNIIEMFQQINDTEISHLLKEGFAEVAEQMLNKPKASTSASLKNMMRPYTHEIQNLFRKFLDDEEMAGMVPGVPTKAALSGVRHGRGSKTRRGYQRPSFIDTGIYRASFRAWVDTK